MLKPTLDFAASERDDGAGDEAMDDARVWSLLSAFLRSEGLIPAREGLDAHDHQIHRARTAEPA